MKKLLLLVSITFISCLTNKENEKLIIHNLVEYIIEKDSLSQFTYSKQPLIHVVTEDTGNNQIKTHVTINNIISDKKDYITDTITIKSFKTIIYKTPNKTFNLPAPFFVPDSRSYLFLTEIIDSTFFSYELKPIFYKFKSDSTNIEFTDF